MEESPVTTEVDTDKKTPNVWFVHCTAIFVQMLFGIGNCIGKEALKNMPALVFAFYREFFAGLILLIVCLIAKKELVHKPDFGRLFCVGLCMFGNQVGFIVGLSFAPAHVASIWQTTQPIITVVLTILFHIEKKSWLKISGVLLATIGSILIISLSGSGGESKGIIIGSLFFLINCVSNSFFFIVSKPLVKRYPPLTVTALSYCVCAVLVMFVSGALYWNKPSAWVISPKGVWCLTYYVLIHSITTYFLMLWCNKYIDSSIVCAYSGIQPVTTLVVALIFLHEKLTIGDSGALLIFLGLGCIVWNSYKEKQEETKQKESEALLNSEEYKV